MVSRPEPGTSRRSVVLDDADRQRFLGAVAEWGERYGLEAHAFVLMDNHYHLLVRTRQANPSQAIGWFKVSYAVPPPSPSWTPKAY